MAGPLKLVRLEPARILPLREDLRLHDGERLPDGTPSWVVEDPLRARFFRIGWLEFEMLARWSLGTREAVIDAVRTETPLAPTPDEVDALGRFLETHELVRPPSGAAVAERAARRRRSLASRVLHNYLMFRIPLWRPDAVLSVWLPFVMPLLGRTALRLSMLAALVGLVLAGRQWDAFVATFVDTMTPGGLLGYLLALVFAKVLHELGHAFTAKKHGLRVAHMGVAVVVLLPMLYTDTAESWRLARRRDRFEIAAAGLRAELMLAAWATLAWAWVPDGPVRGALFFLATASWVATVAINASPFMRFDGYFMLSDATGLPNLHEAGFRAARGWLRRHLLGVEGDPVPPDSDDDAPGWLTAFGLATMVYRLVLFTGIAFAVYHFFFKLLGIFLFLVEIGWFIVRPIRTELAAWWALRARIRRRPALRSATLVVALIALALVPWQERLHGEGWVRAAQDHAIHSPRAARVMSIPAEGVSLAAGTEVARLESSDTGLREAQAASRLDGLDRRMRGSVATDGGHPLRRQTVRELDLAHQERVAASVEARQLELHAPFAGRVVDAEPGVLPGLTVPASLALARVVDTSSWIGEIYVGEDEVRRLSRGAAVRAYLDGLEGEVLRGRVASIDTAPVEVLPHEMLAAAFGGRIATQDEDPTRLRRPLYRLRVVLDGAPSSGQARRAGFVIRGEPHSLAEGLWRAVASQLVANASF